MYTKGETSDHGRGSGRNRLLLGTAGIAGGAALLAAPAAGAATLTVNTNADLPTDNSCTPDPGGCSLRDAIAVANANPGHDMVMLSGLSGEITLTEGDLDVDGTQPLDVVGPDASTLTISGDRNGNDQHDYTYQPRGGPLVVGDSRIFDVDGTGTGAELDEFSVTGLTLADGVANGVSGGDPVLESGGAIRAVDAQVKVTDSVITDNLASQHGGGIAVDGGLEMSGTELSDNRAFYHGGAIWGGGNGAGIWGATLAISDSTITGNEAGGDISDLVGQTAAGHAYGGKGGGLYLKGQLDLQSVEISGNSALRVDYDGRGIGNAGGAVLRGDGAGTSEATDLTVSNNEAYRKTGGVLIYRATVSDSTISGNTAANAGGAYIAGGALVRSTVSGNELLDPPGPGRAWTGGGATIAYWGSIEDSTISGNTGPRGGGIYTVSFHNHHDGNPVRIANTTISDNSAPFSTSDEAPGEGGGIFATAYDDGVTPEITNSTIVGNQAQWRGGGIFLETVRHGASPTIALGLHSTISANNRAGTPAVFDDLNGGGHDQSVPPVDATLNLIEEPRGNLLAPAPANANILGVDPKLGQLADNGGPTQTHLPLFKSPVIDQGGDGGLQTDQRGGPRTVDQGQVANKHPRLGGDGTDVGAVEVAEDEPPKTRYTDRPPNKVKLRRGKRARLRWKFTGSDKETSARRLKFECKLKGGPSGRAVWRRCASPFFARLGVGRYRLLVRAVDQAGNVDPSPAKDKVKVVEQKRRR